MSRLQGRESELAVLDRLLRRAATGQMRIALLEGEAGIGKSALLDEAAELAVGAGYGVRRGGADEAQAMRPFGPLAEAFGCRGSSEDPRAAEIAGMLGGDSAVDVSPEDPGLRYRLVDAFVDLLETEADVGPVLVAIDDLQWADESTLMTLGALARQLPRRPVVLIAALRPFPRTTGLNRLLDLLIRDEAAHIAVEPLDDEAVAAWLERELRAAPGERLLAQARRAAGNPLFLNELLGALGEEGAIEVSGERAEIAQVALPPSLRLTILRRVSFLSSEALELLRIAAILGTAFEAGELACATGRSARELLPRLDEPIHSRIVVASGDELRFRHDLIREAIYEDMPPGLRRSLHLEVARDLAEAGFPAVRVAHHFAIGATAGDAVAADWLARAGRAVGVRDPLAGTTLLERALEVLPDGASARDAVRADLVGLHSLAGRAQEAEALARGILAAPHDPAVEGSVRAGLVHSLLGQGRWTDVVAEADAAAEHAQVEIEVRARLLAEAALARIWTGDLEGARATAERAVQAGEQAGDTAAVALGLGHLSVVHDLAGGPNQAVELARRGLEAAMGSGTTDAQRRHPHIALGMALFGAGQLRESVESLREGRRLGERAGTLWDLPLYNAMLSIVLLHLGEWDDATAEAEAGLTAADETGLGVGLVTAHAVLGTVALHRDDLRAAGGHVQEAEAVVAGSGPQWGMEWLGLAVAQLAAAEGDHVRAVEALLPAWERDLEIGNVHERLRLSRELVVATLHAGQADLAARVVADARAAAAAMGTPWAQARTLDCSGHFEGDPDMLVRAADRYASADFKLEEATAAEGAGDLHAAAGDASAATPLLERAANSYDALSARRGSARVAARLRALGVRRRHGPRVRAESGWESLTNAEREVVRLAAEGLTNPEIGARLFVSRRTVQTHLSHVFTKLGISSRVELAAEVSRRAA